MTVRLEPYDAQMAARCAVLAAFALLSLSIIANPYFLWRCVTAYLFLRYWQRGYGCHMMVNSQLIHRATRRS